MDNFTSNGLNHLYDPDTIVAIITPAGNAGVGIIRISGSKALEIAEKLTGKKISYLKSKPRISTYTKIFNSKNEIIDNGLVVYFAAPNTFTGEEIVELNLHGNQILLEIVINLSIAYGARLAAPGEFSKRAFLNNKIDLTQAEAIADLIAADSEISIKAAVKSLSGVFSSSINDIIKKIIILRTEIEAQLDFSEEDVSEISISKIKSLLKQLNSNISKLINQSEYGRNLNSGINVMLLGSPNVGKSSLFNLFCQESGIDSYAIVTDIPGTTRDLIEKIIYLDELKLNFIDTAGIRETQDKIEKIGIELAKNKLANIDLVLWIDDIRNPSFNLDWIKLKKYVNQETKVIHILNKIDLINLNGYQEEPNKVLLSTLNKYGFEKLKKLIKNTFLNNNVFSQEEKIFTARQRHIDALKNSYIFSLNALDKLNSAKNLDFYLDEIAEDLRLSQNYLGEITGKFTADDLLGEIFSNFCIGK